MEDSPQTEEHMELYILRHGEAEPRATGRPDEDRALTDRGKRQVKAILRQARKELNVDLVLASPLRRARETAELVPGPLRITEALMPDTAPPALWKELREEPAESLILVGHQPQLGQFIAFLLGASVEVDLKKGALLRIDCNRSTTPQGTLKWFLIPRLV
jgi:phosphohistidine phosphatase